MKMNKFIALIAGLVMNAAVVRANTTTYGCHVAANAERGFDEAFTVEISSIQEGGKVLLVLDNQPKELGKIAKINSLHRNAGSTAEQAAFDATLGLIGEEDISGVSADQLGKISSIVKFSIAAGDGVEVAVFRLFNDATQMGGTFFFDGLATACIPGK